MKAIFAIMFWVTGITNGVPSDSIRPILVICAIIVTTIACVTLFSATTMIDVALITLSMESFLFPSPEATSMPERF